MLAPAAVKNAVTPVTKYRAPSMTVDILSSDVEKISARTTSPGVIMGPSLYIVSLEGPKLMVVITHEHVMAELKERRVMIAYFHRGGLSRHQRNPWDEADENNQFKGSLASSEGCGRSTTSPSLFKRGLFSVAAINSMSGKRECMHSEAEGKDKVSPFPLSAMLTVPGGNAMRLSSKTPKPIVDLKKSARPFPEIGKNTVDRLKEMNQRTKTDNDHLDQDAAERQKDKTKRKRWY